MHVFLFTDMTGQHNTADHSNSWELLSPEVIGKIGKIFKSLFVKWHRTLINF